jgi:hypothetical protein
MKFDMLIGYIADPSLAISQKWHATAKCDFASGSELGKIDSLL